jgi:hypothetical protein
LLGGLAILKLYGPTAFARITDQLIRVCRF